MSDPIRRAARTFLQAFLGSVITSGILSTISETAVVDWSGLKKVGIAAASGGLIALISLVQNALEDSNVIPEVVKK